MCAVAFEFAGEKIACNDASCFTIDKDDVHHFVTVVHLYSAECDLT